MNSERFEALIDAVIAIIITIIVLEIPLPVDGSWTALFHERIEFLIYAVSFIVCFNLWNYHQNVFSIVNKIDYKIIWFDGAGLFLLSFLPYLTSMVASNFNSIVAQGLYGLDFLLINTLNLLSSRSLKNADKMNIALQIGLDTVKMPSIVYISIFIGYIIGFTLYPPAIMFSCLVSMILSNLLVLFKKLKSR